MATCRDATFVVITAPAAPSPRGPSLRADVCNDAMTFSRTRARYGALLAVIAMPLVLSGTALAAETALSVESESAPSTGSAWTTTALLGGSALLFAAGYNDGASGPSADSPSLMGATLGVSGMGVAGLGYWWLLEEAQVTRPAGLVTSVAAFQLGWLGLYLLGNGAGLIASDGDRICASDSSGCAGIADNKGA
jgi:hypothetical protein